MLQVSGEDLKFDKEKWSKQLKPIVELWQGLYKIFRDQGGVNQIKASQIYHKDPVDSFVFLEAFQAYQLYEKIELQVDGLNKVLFGNGLLTTEIYQVGLDILMQKVPSKWNQ
jgi:dynein heavy chain 2, cytosolic